MLGLDIEVSISKSLRKSHTDFHCECKFAPPPAMRKNSLFLHPRQHQVPLFHMSPTGPRKYENFFTSGILLKFFLQFFKVFLKTSQRKHFKIFPKETDLTYLILKAKIDKCMIEY